MRRGEGEGGCGKKQGGSENKKKLESLGAGNTRMQEKAGGKGKAGLQ